MTTNNPIKGFDFRFNFEYATAEQITNFLKTIANKWCFKGEESTSENKYKHWQGRLSMIKKVRKSGATTIFNTFLKSINENKTIGFYLEPTLTDEWTKGSFTYIEKLETSITDVYRNDIEIIYEPIQVRKITKLKNWQNDLYNKINIKDNTGRIINVIIDKQGNIGKSTICTYLEFKNNCIDIPPIMDSHYLMATVCDICIAKNKRSYNGMFFDLPRALNKNNLTTMFIAIEEVKKGKLYDVRNKYKEFWIDNDINVWVFTNKLPDINLLSEDRWKFHIINDDCLKEIETTSNEWKQLIEQEQLII